MGCPDRYSPVVSFSMCIRSVAVNSGMSGITTVSTVLLAALMPKKSIWPSTFRRRTLPMPSSTFSYTASSCDRRAPMLSKAPLRIRFSTARLFMSPQSYIRSQKSCKDVKLPPCSRSRTTDWIKPRPMFLMATRPNRMPPGSTVNRSLDRFTSGGSSAMPQSRHSPIYPATLSLLSSTLVSSAAIYSLV